MDLVPEPKKWCIAEVPADVPCPYVQSQSQLPTITLTEAQAKFQREAIRGVCETGRYRCPYYIWGTGPPIVMIPRLADDGLSFLFVSALLAPHFRFIAYDLPAGAEDGARLRRSAHADLGQGSFALVPQLCTTQTYFTSS